MSDANYKVALGLLIKNIQAGQAQHEVILQVGDTPKLLIDRAGMPELPLIIKGNVIDKVHFDHGISRGKLERIVEIACGARAIYRPQPPHLPGCVVISTEIHRLYPVIIAIQRAKEIGRGQIVNEVASIYSKSGNFEQRWNAEGLLLWKK